MRAIFKDHFEETGHTVDVNTHPLGNLFLYAGGKIDCTYLLSLENKGDITKLGKYPYAYAASEKFVTELREILGELYRLRKKKDEQREVSF